MLQTYLNAMIHLRSKGRGLLVDFENNNVQVNTAGFTVGERVVVLPLAAESVGVRSLALFVRTPNLAVLVDPGVALGFREQHPHPLEYRILAQRRATIQAVANETGFIVISHYHHDHFMPFFQNYAYFWSNRNDATALYQEKRIWCKDIRNNVNRSQQGRGYDFVRFVRQIAREVVYADGRAIRVGSTVLRFSPAVPHGESGTHLGWVIMTAIKHKDITVVHASDVQGPMVTETTKWILAQHPQVLIIGGPPTYLSPERVQEKVIAKATENLSQLTEHIPTIVVDHHLLRDINWNNWFHSISQITQAKGHRLMTVAEVLKKPLQMLEAHRSKLYAETPPSPAFNTWVQKIQRGRIKTPPPLEEYQNTKSSD